jgi:GNAT superfamily N-acetyltransferase
MLKVKLTKDQCDAYGLCDERVVSFGGTPYATITGEIFMGDEEIGKMTMYELDADVNLCDMALQIPGDVFVIADAICDLDGNLLAKYGIKNKFVLLDNLFIEPQYRNLGYGTTVANNLLTYLNDNYNNQIDAVVLYASMYEIEDCEEMDLPTFNARCDTLRVFYEKAGYTHMNFNVMMKKKG